MRFDYRGGRAPSGSNVFLLAVTAFVGLLALGGWLRSSTRDIAQRATPMHIPAVAFPVAAGRGAVLLAAARTLTVPVNSILICDNSDGAADVACALEELRGLIAAGTVPARNMTVVARPPGVPRDALLGVSECWNLLATHALLVERAPWVLISNDDVGYPTSPGALARAVREVWLNHASHAFFLANSGLPGQGNSFSSLFLTRAGFAALGTFDENFFPAYYEDCDYLFRAKLSHMPYRMLAPLSIVHPIAPSPATPLFSACLARRGSTPSEKLPSSSLSDLLLGGGSGGSAFNDFITETRKRVQDGPHDAPHGNRVYYQRKWGGVLGACGSGTFETPFNDVSLPLSAWVLDKPRRQAILRGEL